MRQARYPLAQHLAVAADIGRTHLEQIIEAAGDHVALLDLADRQHRAAERVERGLARVGQLHLGERDVVEPEHHRIEHRAETPNIAIVEQTFQSDLARRLRQADAPRELGHRHPAVVAQQVDDTAIELVDRASWLGVIGHLTFSTTINWPVRLLKVY
ncbi:conserved hypothetical protein [Sphingomonas aurantiaca]|uniref:Uncharacterized protein n=1 Tax=Sphingomonas aurantiaca TaxID=185949 RepID=A0A5E7ZCS4_9SPHN|nr:conserved hypothetical protein [Sphingomonas aurantiaca]